MATERSAVQSPRRHLAPPNRTVLTELQAARLVAQELGEQFDITCLQRRHRNEVFAVGDRFILKVYTRHATDKVGRKLAADAALRWTNLSVPRVIGSGWLDSSCAWTIETALATGARPPDLDSFQLHLSMGKFMADLHVTAQVPDWICGGWAADETAADYMWRSLSESIAKARHGGHPFSESELSCVESAYQTAVDLATHDCSSSKVFVHGGYTAANVSAYEVDETVAIHGVFDFEDAHPGDGAEDFAYIGLYGLQDPRMLGAMDGYRLSTRNELSRCGLAHIRFWIIVNALGIIEWGSRLGDTDYLALAFRALEECAAAPSRTDH